MAAKKLVLAMTVGLLASGVWAEGSHENMGHEKHMKGDMKMNSSDMHMQHQATCPVTGENIDKNVYVDHEGQRVYFCCESCKASFKKEPEKYLKKLHSQGVTLEKISSAVPQKTCPVMGGKINKELYVDYKGQRIYACCPGCIESLKKEPEKYLKKMKDMGEEPEKL